MAWPGPELPCMGLQAEYPHYILIHLCAVNMYLNCATPLRCSAPLVINGENCHLQVTQFAVGVHCGIAMVDSLEKICLPHTGGSMICKNGLNCNISVHPITIWLSTSFKAIHAPLSSHYALHYSSQIALSLYDINHNVSKW